MDLAIQRVLSESCVISGGCFMGFHCLLHYSSLAKNVGPDHWTVTVFMAESRHIRLLGAPTISQNQTIESSMAFKKLRLV